MSAVAAAQMDTQSALDGLIAAGHMPAAAQDRALDLQAQLAAPTRVTLLGWPRVGKSTVFNLLAGAPVVLEGCDLGTVQLVHGPVERTTLTLADRETVTLDGLPSADTAAEFAPALTRIEAPLPALARISLMELAQPTEPNGQRRAIAWAIKQTDVMIWCTETFTQVEGDQWAHVPEHVQDHSILLRTKSDLLRHQTASVVEGLSARVGDQFRHVLAVSAHEALAARASAEVDKERMRAAGGTKLISTLLKEIEAGRQYAVDQADILLAQYPAPVSQPKTAIDPAPATAQPSSAAEPVQSDNAVVFDAAIDHLQAVGQALAANVDAAPREVLSQSADALDWLRTHLEAEEGADTDAYSHLQNMTQDAEDLVQLMRMEQSQDTATDAVLLLLQLKRELQAARAA